MKKQILMGLASIAAVSCVSTTTTTTTTTDASLAKLKTFVDSKKTALTNLFDPVRVAAAAEVPDETITTEVQAVVVLYNAAVVVTEYNQDAIDKITAFYNALFGQANVDALKAAKVGDPAAEFGETALTDTQSAASDYLNAVEAYKAASAQ